MSHLAGKLRQFFAHTAYDHLDGVRCHAESRHAGNLGWRKPFEVMKLEDKLVTILLWPVQGKIQTIIDLILQFHHARGIVSRFVCRVG